MNMRTTSADVGYGSVHRRYDSDDDSAISLSLDNGTLEKQPFLLSRAPRSSAQAQAAWTSGEQKSSILSLPKQTFLFLLPSYISHRLKGPPTRIARSNVVAALDGLRGLACLLVFNEHLTLNFTKSIRMGYGINGSKSLLQWPFIRILWSGYTMVAIFFVISGYVLSYKPLQHIYNGNISDGHQTLTSSALRRGFRLYIPTFAAVVLCGVASWVGLFDKSRTIYSTSRDTWGLEEESPPIYSSILHQLNDITQQSFRLLDIWNTRDGELYAGNYDLHTWTIPIEFRNSMILFLILLSVSRLRATYRLLAQVAIIMFTITTKNKNMLLFLSGMLLADMDLQRKSRNHFLTFTKTRRPSPSVLSLTSPNSIWYPLFFITGLFICSIPVHGCEYDPLYGKILKQYPVSLLKGLTGPAEWFRVPGAILIVWSAANSAILAPIFTNRFTSYLGKISFALYLVHGSIIRMVLHANMPLIYSITNNGTREGQNNLQRSLSWLLGAILVVPVTFWVADVFWRAIDVPCVKVGKWLEDKLSARDHEGSPCTTPKRWAD